MLPVAGKPILEWNLEALATCGFKKIVMVVGYKKEIIQRYFGKKFKNLNIEYVEQREQLGTAHAVSMAEKKVKNDFLIMNGDILVSEDIIKKVLKEHKNEASMCLARVSQPEEYGIAELGGRLVKSIEEKPEKPRSNLANAGVYIFNKSIFEVIRKLKKSERMEYELTDALKELIKQKRLDGSVCRDRWMDIGKPWDLLDANEITIKRLKEFKVSKKATVEKYTVLKGQVAVGDGTVIKSGAYIEGPCIIGKNCTVGPNCFIRPYTVLMDDCRVGNGVEVKNCIIMAGTVIGHLSYVGDSIIGEKCNFGAGTKVANLRFDDSEVKVMVKEELKASGRRKFGCLMGDNVKTGINVSIMPGRSIYPGAWVSAGSVVRNTIYAEEQV